MLLGADVGTSGLKLVALDEDGAVVAEAEEDYEPERPQPGWAQNDVGTWLTALERAVDRLAVGPVQALGLSGQMHGAVWSTSGARHSGRRCCGRTAGPPTSCSAGATCLAPTARRSRTRWSPG